MQFFGSVAQLNRWVACALAASIPNDALFALVAENFGRSPSYYVGMAAAVVSVPLLPRIALLATASLPLILLVSGATFSVLVWAVWGTADAYMYDRPLKCAYMAALFLWAGRDAVWRRRLLDSYVAGCADIRVHYDEVTRRAVLGMNENVQSVIAASGMVLLIPMACRSTTKLRALLIFTGFVLGGSVFVLGASRTGSAALAAGVLFAVAGLLRSREFRLPVRMIVVACAASAVLVVSALGRNSSPISHDVAESAHSLGTRIQAAISGDDLGMRDETSGITWKVFLRNPVGVGYAGTEKYLGGDPHNSYLKIAAEGGLAAVLLLVTGLALIARNVVRALRHADLVGPAAAFVLFSAAALTGQAIEELPYWFFVSFVAFPPSQVEQSMTDGTTGAWSPGVAGGF
jgi:O-antigen ligase